MNSKVNSTPLLLTALMLAGLAAVYYYVVMPKTDEVSTLESSVTSLQSNITSLQQQMEQLDTQQNAGVANEFAVRKKLPDKRNIEQLLLNIEEMEFVTGTRVTSIGFNNYDTLVSGSGLADPNAPAEDETTQDPNVQTTESTTETTATPTATTTTTENTETAETQEVPVSTIDVATLPPNLKMITFNVEVEAPNEKALLKFIKEVEKLERVMNVEDISFELHGEENLFAEEASQVVSTTVQVTTFYYE